MGVFAQYRVNIAVEGARGKANRYPSGNSERSQHGGIGTGKLFAIANAVTKESFDRIVAVASLDFKAVLELAAKPILQSECYFVRRRSTSDHGASDLVHR